MRVCLDLTPLWSTSRFRGIGMYALGLARGLSRSGHLLTGIDLHLLVGAGREMRVVPFHERWLSPEAWRDDRVMSDTLYYATKQTIGSSRVSLARLDLYHATDPKGAPRPWGCRTVVTCHDLIPVVLGYPFSPGVLPRQARRLVEWQRYRSMDHVIAISRCTRDDLQRITGYPTDRTSVVQHGVDSNLFRPERGDDEVRALRDLLGSDRPYFLYIGGFDRRKRVPDLVRALGRCAESIDELLVICGRMDPEVQRALEEEIDAAGVRDRVRLLGFVDHELLPTLYRGATAHTLASEYEGFGLTITEAFACGCPVIGAAASCVPETVGDAGLLCPPLDVDAFSEAMVQVASDTGLRGELRRKGLQRAALFTWERCAEDTLEVYRRVVGDRGRCS